MERLCENQSCRRPFRIRRATSRFCSRPCLYAGITGSLNPQWRGGRHVTKQGYVKLYRPDHPSASGHGGYVAEHRLVMEAVLGRYLEPIESVHHRNGVKADNRPENLELWLHQPKGQRVTEMLDFIVKHYRTELLARLTSGG